MNDRMMPRCLLLLCVLLCWCTTKAQDRGNVQFRYCAISFCKTTQQPLGGVLITLKRKSGDVDSLLTDSLGVARTSTGADTLALRPNDIYRVDVAWPNGPLRLRDEVVTDTLHESTTFVKEYYLSDCCTRSDHHRYEPPSVYFPENSSHPRTDSAWYQQEQVNGVEEAIDAMVELMKENPTIIVKTIGYCDAREKNREQLALARADHVRNLLIEQGIAPARLQAEGRAEDHRYLGSEIARMKDREKRENARARNRYVGYLVVSTDYRP